MFDVHPLVRTLDLPSDLRQDFRICLRDIGRRPDVQAMAMLDDPLLGEHVRPEIERLMQHLPDLSHRKHVSWIRRWKDHDSIVQFKHASSMIASALIHQLRTPTTPAHEAPTEMLVAVLD